MAINKTTTETKNKIKANSVIALPNRPQIPAEQLKQAFVKPIVDTSNSMIQELDRIVEETNAEIDTINGTLSEHDFRINELEDFASNLEIDITEEILTKAKIEEKLTGDITSHNHATEIGNHNTSETAHTNIRNAVAEAKAIAEGKSRARVFATKSALDTWLLESENVALLQIGDNFYIEEIDKPDYWWNGTTIKELETQKVDLTEYAKKTELLTLGTTSDDAYRGDLGQTAYEHSQSTHAPTNAQANVIEGVQVNGVDLSVANKKVNVTVPTIPDISLNDNQATAGKYISKIEVDATDKHKLIVTKADLPTGFSGSYNDLTDKPTIPTNTSDLTNDSGFLTSLPTHNHTKSEITDFPTSMTPTAHNHTKSEITDFPTIPTKTSDLTNDSGFLTALPTHNHDSDYYKKSETYSKEQTDALVGNLQGQTQELKSITTQPSGTFEVGDLYYNSTTKGMYYWTGSSWELTGLGEPIAGVIYSFNGILYFWDESTLNLIQIGGGVDLSNYYTKTEADNAINSAILGLLGGES